MGRSTAWQWLCDIDRELPGQEPVPEMLKSERTSSASAPAAFASRAFSTAAVCVRPTNARDNAAATSGSTDAASKTWPPFGAG